jgi:hypothetical protein
MRRWVGRRFEPEKIELERVNKKLATMARRFDRATRRGR